MLSLILIVLFVIFAQPISSEQCFVPGKCVEEIGHISTVIVPSVEDCIAKCASGNICKWSTFDMSNGYCELFKNICDEVDYTKCPLCLNNELDCSFGKYLVSLNVIS